MLDINNVVAGYEPAAIALFFVLAYYLVVALIVSRPGPPHTSVPRYEPPKGASPGVAAWLMEDGKLPRATAAALVNMAAKGYVKIEQTEDLCSVTRLQGESVAPLEFEEDALDRTLFSLYDCFTFDQMTLELSEAVTAFRWALLDTTYASPNYGLSIPAWIVSGLGALFALFKGTYLTHFGGNDPRGFFHLHLLILVTSGCFVLAVRTLPGTLEKIFSRLPGSTAPQRAWTGADLKPLTFLIATVGGVVLVALAGTPAAAFFVAGFMVVNGIFYHVLQSLTPAGREIVAQLEDYKKFLSEVDADVISRMQSSEHPPAQMDSKDAYAIAFHLDLGRGEQFVSSIADLVEYADLTPSK